jgi:two-component system cell cycle sensor histidine kinase/response regulator CckA
LLVEDETAVRNLTSRILKDRGYQVLEASHGPEALQISRAFKEKIHLIITDVVMPGMRGNVLLERIESERPNIKSLYISGYTDNALAHQGIPNSEVAFLQKPFSIENLTHKVREILDSGISSNA